MIWLHGEKLVNFGPVGLTPESSISSLATFVTARHWGDQYWVLCGDQYSALFHLFASGRHCHAARATR